VILAVSTSSPLISLAVIHSEKGLQWAGSTEAPMAASGACLEMLNQMTQETGLGLQDIDLFAADIGPGSFTGVRVGVTLMKCFGYLWEKPVAGASSFDLISTESTVVFPSKKGEFFVRRAGEEAIRTSSLPAEPFVGFGPGIDAPVRPNAVGFVSLMLRIKPMAPMNFVPLYLIEPSISTPKTPFPLTLKVGA